MAYVADPTNAAQPADSADASGGAAELRALKGYLQTLLQPGGSIPVTGYAWQGFRNKIINGNFSEWQRGTSLGAAAANRYLSDRWFNSSAGTTNAPSRQAFTVGQTVVPYEPAYFHRTIVSSVAGAGNLCNLQHRIEGVRTFAGQTGILSFWAKADAAKDIAIEFQQVFGSGGAPSADVTAIGVTKKTLSTVFQYFTVPVTVPSISGKTLGTAGNDFLGVNFWFDAGSNFNARTGSLGQQSGTFDIAQVQFELGSSTTPFELLPPHIIIESCSRFYTTGLVRTAIYNNNYIGYTTKFPATMRASPTLVASDLVGNVGRFTSATNGNNQSITGGALTVGYDANYFFTDALINAGNGNWVAFTYTADAEL